MKILFITSAFPSKDYPKSNSHNFRSIINLSKIENNKIKVIHLRSWKPCRKIWEKNLLSNINVYSFSFPYLPMLPKFILAFNLIIYKKILFYFFIKNKIKKYNIIHTAGVSMESIVGAYISKKSGVKHVAQCMGSDINISLPKKINHFGWRNFEKNVDLFTCNSIALKNSLKKIIQNKKVITVYRGVNLNDFQYSPISIKSKIYFLYLGGLISNPYFEKFNYKGGITLLRAWHLLFEKHEKSINDIKLLFGGPNTNNKIVKQILGKNPSNINIEVIGQIPINEVKYYMKKSAVIIIPSFAEGLPNVAMEAAATGRPIIGTKVGGLPEIISNEKTGFLFESGNYKQLSKLIIQYINNPKLITLHGKNARKVVEKNFDSNFFAKKYSEIYYNLYNNYTHEN